MRGLTPPPPSRVGFYVGADDAAGFFKEAAVGLGEGGWGVAVDIDFAYYFAVGVDGDYDFGFGLDGAGEITRVGVDVVYDYCFSRGGCRAADAFRYGDADVGGGGADIGAEDEGLVVVGVEHVKAGPVGVGGVLSDGLDDGLLEGFEGWCGCGQLLHAG